MKPTFHEGLRDSIVAMPDAVKTSLGFYCRVHQLRFQATRDGIIKCELGGHLIGDGFPDQSWWEFCCDCSTFWLLPPVNDSAPRTQCLVCERTTARRYVCDHCQVLSIESDSLVRRKAHSIVSAEGIKPSCPGCSTEALGRALEHDCAETATSFLTSRDVCPFCEHVISSGHPNQREDVCLFCGTEKKPGYKFCRKCGNRQEDLPPPSESIARAGQLARECSLTEAGGWPGYEDGKPAASESDNYETVDNLAATSTAKEKATDRSAEFNQPPAYIPSWQTALAPTALKSRANWLPAAIAVALTLIVVITLAIFLSAKRAGPKPPLPDQAQSLPAGMALIRGGEFIIGRDTGDEYEKPAHKITLKAFLIDVCEVTCGDYEKFVKATNHRAPTGWINGACAPGVVRNPVTGVDWYDASAYAQWIGKRLPTEEEWELAARGNDGRIYPWGNEWRNNAANAGGSSPGHVVDVGSYPDGKSLFGMMDMVGNAWEWTASDLKAYPGGRLSEQTAGELKVIRGGFWGSSAPKATTTFRRGWDSRDAPSGYKNTGFRCARDV